MTDHTDFIHPTTGQIDTAGLMEEFDRMAEENAALDFKLRQSARSEVALRKQLAAKHSEGPLAAEVREVLEYWAEQRAKIPGTRKVKLDMHGDRADKIRARLNQSPEPFTVADLKEAVDGMLVKPYVGPQGRSAEKKPGCNLEVDLELILRDGRYVERFQGYAREAKSNPGSVGSSPEKPTPVGPVMFKPKLQLVEPEAAPYDPFPVVWKAVEQKGLEPKGEVWRFRACCPQHETDPDRSLLVTIGGDGRATIWCSRYCFPENIAKALGLQWGELFPSGHRDHRLPKLRQWDREGRGAA